MSVEMELKNYIAKNILFSDNGFPYKEDDSFLEEGIVDSVGIMELVAFVEENYKFKVKDEDITPENFDSVRQLAEFIHRNQNKLA